MEISLKVSDDLAARARAQGMSVEEYVQKLLSQPVDAVPSGAIVRKSEAEVRAWLSAMAQFSDKIPSLPETITRDWIYQEHD
jgi:uncharacterized protein YciW